MTVKTGAQVLYNQGFSQLRGLRIGFAGNHTAMISDEISTLASLVESGAVTVAALFGPEHGAFGTFDEDVPDLVEPLTSLRINSLYGAHKKPTADMLTGLDALVFEMQDVGARFYTYASTLGLCLEACAEAGIPLIVLDRPNPITGARFEGPIADKDRLSFTAYHPIPVRHGLTIGELARLYAAELGYADAVQVISCSGLRRADWFDQTGVTWRNPSPAMRTMAAATLYPGVCLLEQTNFSVGRGTSAPFEIVGAPWVNSCRWIDALNKCSIPGVRYEPVDFTPTLRDYAGELCNGIHIAIEDRDALDSVRFGIALIVSLRDTFPESFDHAKILNLLANQAAFDLIDTGAPVDEIVASWSAGLADWSLRRTGALLYS